MKPDEKMWQAQLAYARKLLEEKGREELRRHAEVSIRHHCRCGQCFCCAAKQVYLEHARE